MIRLFDLLFSYTMIGGGFVVFGILAHSWVFPDRLTGGSLLGLAIVSFVLGLLGGVLLVMGLSWHRTATNVSSLAGPRKL